MTIKVSIITAAYNAEKYIGETIKSVLSQTFTDWEYIIIDDGSNDGTKEIIKKYLYDKRIKYFFQENRGVSSARNLALSKSQGKYIAIIDADDFCFRERIQKEFDFLEKNTLCIAVGSNAKIIDKDGRYLFTSNKPLAWEVIKNRLPKMPFYNSSTMFRKEIAMKCGGYLDSMSYSEDCLLFNLMSKYGELWNIPEPLICYRIVPSSISNRNKKSNLIMGDICNNLLESGTNKESYMEISNTTIKKKSENWKMSDYYLRIGKVYIEYNFNRKNAFINLVISIFWKPYNIHSWFNIFLLLLPNKAIKKWKDKRFLR